MVHWSDEVRAAAYVGGGDILDEKTGKFLIIAVASILGLAAVAAVIAKVMNANKENK